MNNSSRQYSTPNLEKQLKKDQRDTSKSAEDWIIRNHGSREAFEEEEKRIKNVENGVIDWYQLLEYCREKLPEFNMFYASYLENEEPPLSEYGFFSNVLTSYLLALLEQGEIKQIQKVWDVIESLLEKGDSSVKNELLVVLTEEINLNKYKDFISDFTKEQIEKINANKK